MNRIKNNVDTLFSKADTMNSDDLKEKFKALMKEGDKSLKQSGKLFLMMNFDYFILKFFFILDSKIQVAIDMQNLISKYIKRLDIELHGFKIELESDKSGITQLIEKSTSLINKIFFVICNELILEK